MLLEAVNATVRPRGEIKKMGEEKENASNTRITKTLASTIRDNKAYIYC